MLIRFNIENFLSFKEKQSFSLLPGKSTLKANHKTKPIKGISVLKTSILFGANASGKSNLIKAIEFGRELVMNGSKTEQPINFKPFKLDKDYLIKNSYIEYEIQHKNKNYAYGFIFNSKEIVDEWLFEIGKTINPKVIFERTNTINFNLKSLYTKNWKLEEKQFIEFIAKSTPRNQLFLNQIRKTNISDNINDLSDIFNVIDWFQNALTVIYPSSRSITKKFELHEDKNLQHIFTEMLNYFDTGIDSIDFKTIEFEKIQIPNELKEEIRNDLLSSKSEKNNAFLTNPEDDKYYVITKNASNELDAKILKTIHKVSDETLEIFDLAEESDGTRRIMDLIPLIIDFYKGNNVFIIDEIERSLHPNLVKDLFDFIFNRCDTINSQIIVASHEATLLTQKIFRKDEIWFAVKNKLGATILHSLEDYNIRFDKEIMKDYLIGRYKGVPKFGNRESLTILNK
jgi:AAA15 family ATPase/GTPase